MKKKIGHTEIYIDAAHIFEALVPVITVILAAVFLIHLFSFNGNADEGSRAVKNNVQTVKSFDYSDVSTVETQVQELNERDNPKPAGDTDYRQLFSGSIILGDSVTEGLTEYHYLGSDVVFSKIGLSIKSSEDLFNKAAKTYPKNAFFAMGMNDMEMFGGDADAFTKQYRSLLEKFQKESPKTNIYICTISRPGDTAIQKNSYLGNYKKFNQAIEAMCSSMGVTCIQVTDILANHPDLYEPDGLHAKTGYYPLWLDRMARAADLS